MCGRRPPGNNEPPIATSRDRLQSFRRARRSLPVLLFVAWNIPILALDNILKPILMGRGVDAPMLIIFIGAIGGFIGFGFLGLFFGAVVLVIAYDLLVVWLEESQPEA